MRKVELTKTVASSVKDIWNILRTGDGLDKWLPIIESCELIGKGAGAKRICTTLDGKSLKETILLVDDINKVFKYQIDEQDMMPTKNYVGTVTVTEKEGITSVHWLAEFELTVEEAWSEVEKRLTDLLNLCITSLDEAIK